MCYYQDMSRAFVSNAKVATLMRIKGGQSKRFVQWAYKVYFMFCVLKYKPCVSITCMS